MKYTNNISNLINNIVLYSITRYIAYLVGICIIYILNMGKRAGYIMKRAGLQAKLIHHIKPIIYCTNVNEDQVKNNISKLIHTTTDPHTSIKYTNKKQGYIEPAKCRTKLIDDITGCCLGDRLEILT